MPYLRRTSAPSVEAGSDADIVATWVAEELESIERSQRDDIIALELRPTGRAPDKPREGMIIYADTVYDPGSGVRLPYYFNGSVWVPFGSRILTANTQYFVRKDGSDANTGLVNSAGGAFLTANHALDVITKLNFNGFTVTLTFGAGTWAENIVIPRSWIGGSLIIEGASKTTTFFSGANGPAFDTNNAPILGGLTLQKIGLLTTAASGTTRGHLLMHRSVGTLNFNDLAFGTAVNGIQIITGVPGAKVIGRDYSISGSAQAHWAASYAGSAIEVAGDPSVANTVTITTAVTFTSAFAFALGPNLIFCPFLTFTGKANVTAQRFILAENGVINTLGTDQFTYLPGTSNGTNDGTGRYD